QEPARADPRGGPVGGRTARRLALPIECCCLCLVTPPCRLRRRPAHGQGPERPARDCVTPTKLSYRSIVGAFRPRMKERIMKNIQSLKKRVHARLQTMIVSAALAIGMAAPASAAQSDPEVIIYRFPGVRDDGNGTNLGVATVVHCMNFSGATEN